MNRRNFPEGIQKAPGVDNGVVYFDGFTQGRGVNALTATNARKTQYTNFAIYDAKGQPVLINPALDGSAR